MTKLKNTVVARVVLTFVTLIAGARLLVGRLIVWAAPQIQASTQAGVPGVRLVKGAPSGPAQIIPVVNGSSLKRGNESSLQMREHASRGDHSMTQNRPFCVNRISQPDPTTGGGGTGFAPAPTPVPTNPGPTFIPTTPTCPTPTPTQIG